MGRVEGSHRASPPPADPCRILLGAEWPRTTSRTILSSRNPTVTARIKSKYSKASMPSANDPRCTSAARAWTGCTISSTKSWTTASTNIWPASGKPLRSRSISTAASRSSITDAAFPPACIPHKRNLLRKWRSPSCMRAANLNRAPIRCPAVCMVSASRSSTRCPNGWSWKSGRTARCSSNATSAESPRRHWPSPAKPNAAAPRCASSPTARYSKRWSSVSTSWRSGSGSWPFSTKAWRSRSRTIAKKRNRSSITRAASSPSSITSTRRRHHCTSRFTCKRNGPTSSWKWRCNTTTGMPKTSSPSRTTSTPKKAAPIWWASKPL